MLNVYDENARYYARLAIVYFFFAACFGALDFRGTAYERLITGIRGRRQVEATGIVREHRIIAQRRASLGRMPELFGFNGIHGERFWTGYGMTLFIKIHKTRRDDLHARNPLSLLVDRRSKKNQCALTRWRNVPIRAIFTANVNIYRVE